MKSYDETVDAVFDRIHAFEAKKKRRIALTRRVAVSCCAVLLLGVGVWQMNHLPDDVPISGIVNNNNGKNTTTTINHTNAPSVTTNGITESPFSTTASTSSQTIIATSNGTTTAQTTVTPSTNTTQSHPTTPPMTTPPVATTPTTIPTQEKVLIKADKPDYYDVVWPDEEISRNRVYISPMLQETMEQYKEINAVYFVIVELPATKEDCDEFSPTEELLQLENEKKIAYQEFLAALKEAGGYYPPEVVEKRNAYRALAKKQRNLKNELMQVHIQAVLMKRVDELARWSNSELVSLSTDTRFQPIFAYDSNYAFLMELTADEIYELAERGGYVIRLSCPDGEEDWLMNDGLVIW